MKPIKFTPGFHRNFRSRIAQNEQLVKAYKWSVETFLHDPALVGDHPLEEPMRDRRAFWVTNEYRVVYRVKGNYILFDDIGTHKQVYQR